VRPAAQRHAVEHPPLGVAEAIGAAAVDVAVGHLGRPGAVEHHILIAQERR
jgi:hypothetical protein